MLVCTWLPVPLVCFAFDRAFVRVSLLLAPCSLFVLPFLACFLSPFSSAYLFYIFICFASAFGFFDLLYGCSLSLSLSPLLSFLLSLAVCFRIPHPWILQCAHCTDLLVVVPPHPTPPPPLLTPPPPTHPYTPLPTYPPIHTLSPAPTPHGQPAQYHPQ